MRKKVWSFMKMKVRRMDPDRVRVVFFVGCDEKHYQRAGELVMDVGDWQTFGCALGMGIERMTQVTFEAIHCPMKITSEGEMEALGRMDELCGKPDVSISPRWLDPNQSGVKDVRVRKERRHNEERMSARWRRSTRGCAMSSAERTKDVMQRRGSDE